jgi:hypothetical protein
MTYVITKIAPGHPVFFPGRPVFKAGHPGDQPVPPARGQAISSLAMERGSCLSCHVLVFFIVFPFPDFAIYIASMQRTL